MKSGRVKRPFQLILFCLSFSAYAGDLQLRLSGDRLSLNAQNASLAQVLDAFASYGIQVEAPENMDLRFSLRFEDRPLDDALRDLLDDINHVTLWREFKVGTGNMIVLEGIRIAPAGLPAEALRRVAPPLPRVITLPDGSQARADELLVGLRPGVTPESFRALLNSMGAHVIDADPGLGIYRIRLPAGSHLPDILERLSRENSVAAAEPNRVWSSPSPVFSASSIPAVSANAAAPANSSPALAIFDSGLHPDFKDAAFLRSAYDATGLENTDDSAGHGTQMALLGSGVISPLGLPLPDTLTPVISIRSMEADGKTTTFGVLKGLTYAREQGARVVGMSWGAYAESRFLDSAFADATSKGMLLLAAAGNDGRDELMYPASSEHVIAVGALAQNGALWKKSNTGSGLSLLVPGEAILPIGFQGDPGRYAGTSIATAAAASLLTQLTERYPQADNKEILRRVRENTISSKFPGTENARVLDAEALRRLQSP
jgi:hypothetical protein